MAFIRKTSIFLAESYHTDAMTDHRTAGQTADLLKKDTIFNHCLLLHICIHLSVWCHDTLQIMLKFQASIHKTVYLKEMTHHVLSHLHYSLQSTGT